MPFVRSVEGATVRLYPPADLPGVAPGDWVEITTIYTAGMRSRLTVKSFMASPAANGGQTEVAVNLFAFREALLAEIIRAWSDPEPVTPEAVATLHPDLADWIAREFDARNAGVRSDEEKKESSERTSPTSAPPADPSPPSSDTSSSSNGLGITA